MVFLEVERRSALQGEVLEEGGAEVLVEGGEGGEGEAVDLQGGEDISGRLGEEVMVVLLEGDVRRRWNGE